MTNNHTALPGDDFQRRLREATDVLESIIADRGLLAQASTLLSRRVIRLHVGGTVRSPSIQIQPLLLLTEEAVRFFLTRVAIPLP